MKGLFFVLSTIVTLAASAIIARPPVTQCQGICFNPLYIWDVETCTCLPPDDPKPCQGYCFNPLYVWDVKTCSCVLHETPHCELACFPGWILETSNGSCYCRMEDIYTISPSPCAITCTERQYLDEFNCQCLDPLCAKLCPPGYVIDRSNCTSCSDCGCKPDPDPIPSCDSSLIDCMVGYTIDPLLCQCVPVVQPSCPPGRVYDVESCSCKCEDSCTDCAENFVWDEHMCDCVCPLGQKCQDGFSFDLDVCGCVCDKKIECDEGFIFNEDKCVCICIANETCAYGTVWDEYNCQCVPEVEPTCGEGFIYSKVQCRCVCATENFCTSEQVFDENVCKCVCPIQYCEFGYFNPDTCQCEEPVRPLIITT